MKIIPYLALACLVSGCGLSNRDKATMMAGVGVGTLTPGLTMMANNVNHPMNDLDDHKDMLGGMEIGAGLGAVTGGGLQYLMWNHEPFSDRTKCAIAGFWMGAGMSTLGSVGLLTLDHSRPATHCGADPSDANCSFHEKLWDATLGSVILGGAIGAIGGYLWCGD